MDIVNWTFSSMREGRDESVSFSQNLKNNWKTKLTDVRCISMQMTPLANFLLVEFELWFGSSLVASIIMA